MITAYKTDRLDDEGGYRKPDEKRLAQERALERPVARPHLARREDRLQCSSLRAAYSLYIWEEQKKYNTMILPACEHCGQPTGAWCDGCEIDYRKKWANAICRACDEDVNYGFCKRCLEAGHRR